MVIAVPEQLPEFLHDEWEERSAIMEYDGGLPRDRAEALAFAEILEQMGGSPVA